MAIVYRPTHRDTSGTPYIVKGHGWGKFFILYINKYLCAGTGSRYGVLVLVNRYLFNDFTKCV